MDFEPIEAPFGAFVARVDFADLDGRELRRALNEHKLLCVRGREIDDDEHLAFASAFGRLASEKTGVVTLVSNVVPGGSLGADEATWHSDYTFFPSPYECISLYAVALPAAGTETYFTDGVLAAQTLPDSLRRRVAGLRGRSVAVISPTMSLTAGVRYRAGRCDGVDPHQERPVLWPHPITGEDVLAVWEQQTDAILPLPDDESVALVEELYDHLYQPAHQYVHHWQPHDLVLWDNLALQHARPYIGTAEARTLRRVSVGEDQDISIFLERFGRGSAS
jgi:taurine dioxygenase